MLQPLTSIRDSAYGRLGQGGGCFLHDSRCDFNDKGLPPGAALFASLVERSLPLAVDPQTKET